MLIREHSRRTTSSLMPQSPPNEPDYDPYELLVSPSDFLSPTSTPDPYTSQSHSTIRKAGKGCQEEGISEDNREMLADNPQKRPNCSDFGLLLNLDEAMTSTMPTAINTSIECDVPYGTESFCTEFSPLKPVFEVAVVENPPKKPVRAVPQKRPREQTANLDRRNLQNCPLKGFWQRGKPMKHEFFIIKLTRKLVHSNKKAVKGVCPQAKGLLSVLSNSQTAKSNMEAFIAYVQDNKECFDGLVKPDHMPMSDCKDVRENDSQFASYSKGFFAWFMGRSPYLVIAFHLFCEVVFEGTPETLCKAWGMQCCQDLCGPDCVEKWRNMKRYTQHDLLEELGLRPVD